MRDLLFLFTFDFIWVKRNINSPREGLLSSFTFELKCLDCAINLLIHTFSEGSSVSSRLLPLVGVKWRVFLKQQLVPSKFNLPGILLVTLKEWLVLREKLNYTQKNIRAKVKRHQPSFLIFFLYWMLKSLRFVQDCSVCVNNKESTS